MHPELVRVKWAGKDQEIHPATWVLSSIYLNGKLRIVYLDESGTLTEDSPECIEWVYPDGSTHLLKGQLS